MPTAPQNSRNFSIQYIVNKTTMKSLIAFVFVLFTLVPVASAQSSASFAGKWEGTFTLQGPDGAQAQPRPIVFNITQKGKEISGTAGPVDQQEKIVNGIVAGNKVTFDVQMPQGPPFKFALTLVKGRLQGDMTRENNGTVRQAKVDAGKATAEKTK